MKKIVLALAASLMLVASVGCGNKTTEPNKTPANNPGQDIVNGGKDIVNGVEEGGKDIINGVGEAGKDVVDGTKDMADKAVEDGKIIK